MDLKLHLLESFNARGSDGKEHKVMAYEHMRRDESVQDGQEHWASTGKIEYRLDSGEVIDVHKDGSMKVAASGLTLQRG